MGDGGGAHEAYLRGAKTGERAGVAVGIPDDRLETVNLAGIASKREQRPLFVNTVFLPHSPAMGLQIRQKLSSLWPILVKPSVFAFDAPSPTG